MQEEQIGEGILLVSTLCLSICSPGSAKLPFVHATRVSGTVMPVGTEHYDHSSLANTVDPLSPLELSPLGTPGDHWPDVHTHLVTFPGYVNYLGQPLGWNIQTQFLRDMRQSLPKVPFLSRLGSWRHRPGWLA